MRFCAIGAVMAGALTVSIVSCAPNAVSRGGFEQTYLAARFNWAFRDRFSHADRLLNAFDYGHAKLYQILITRHDAAQRLEGEQFDFITRQLLRNPPNVPLEEAAIGPDYAKLAPEVLAMFEWAHGLHRQLYDVWAAPGLTGDRRDHEVARVVAYYRSRRDLAFSARPKSMALMEGQRYSLAFRKQDPKFNGLLWSYHWYQMALYDALIDGRTERQLQAGVDTVITRFFAMLEDAPSRMPNQMPMSAAVAPRFAERYPEAAIIFDNLHSLHDVVADILVSSVVPREQKRAAILTAAAAYRDDTTSVITVEEWRAMARMMSPTPPGR